ncbi:hypothetical protein HOF65_03245 [bacterium]|jgi:hypothetical protein|nr:hypothetical protein [bacterium]MBT3853006.1 hypothetical protein [bacterium]MBT4633276.1 hypothetical protein [bacterium]MBT5491989.1 hypothetical protein [bacterium]MBT6778257.1 hypothetical protein [bacterium]
MWNINPLSKEEEKEFLSLEGNYIIDSDYEESDFKFDIEAYHQSGYDE